MKIYIQESSVALVGKSWEIRKKLKEYGKDYVTVSDWIKNERVASKKRSKVIPFPDKQLD
ncbi:Z-ring formation inhibitor MciZ [Bacillus sp. RD4P76]|uniref:Z-ring formation inhibitor MciZ n=1 Tax=Bacillus suaedaesalsae TaxID=2810349 RepID=A0ABS2DNC2_9BACI|nr:Z-ring formation inhibitor MciZ [Bacillus suaedaesalsae]